MGVRLSRPQSPLVHTYITDVLKHAPFMQLLDDALIAEIARCFDVVKYARGALIKTDAHQFFIVAEGAVDISSLVPTVNTSTATRNTKQHVTEFLCQRNVGDYICYTSREQLLTRLLLASADGAALFATKKKLMKLLDLNKTSADATRGCTLLKLDRERFAALRSRLGARRPNVKNTARFSGGKSMDRQPGNALTAAEKFHLVKSIVESEIVSYLLDIPFLEHVEESRLVTLSNLCSYVFVRRGDVLCREGDVGDRFYICIRGSLQATVNVHLNAASQTYATIATADETRGASTAQLNAARCGSIASDATQQLQGLKRLSSGSYFGEIALLFQIPRVASIAAVDDSLLVAIDRATFCNFLKMVPHASLVLLEHVRMHFLDTLLKQGCAFLHAIAPLKLQELSAVSELEEHRAGATIIAKGEKHTAFYILLRGEVRMVYEYEYDDGDSKDNREGGGDSSAHASASAGVSAYKTRQSEIVLVRPGGYFGQEALILRRGGAGSSVHVTCTDHCIVLKLSREAFDDFFPSLPEVYAEFCIKCLRDRARPEHVMQHYDAHKLWSADCVARRRHHDVALFEYIEDYRYEADVSDDRIHERALVIYMKFLAASAPCPVTSISTSAAHAIEHALCTQSVDRDVFAAARDEILASMDDAHFAAFKRSRTFLEFLASLHCPQPIYDRLTPALEERLSMSRKHGRGHLALEALDDDSHDSHVSDDDSETDEDLATRIASNKSRVWGRRSSATVFSVANSLASTAMTPLGRYGTSRDLSTLASDRSDVGTLDALHRRKSRVDHGPRRLSSTFVF